MWQSNNVGKSWVSETMEPGSIPGMDTSGLLESDRNEVPEQSRFRVFCNKQPNLIVGDTNTMEDK